MTTDMGIVRPARRATRTLYVITFFYVAMGFFVAVPAAVSGDRLSTFLGFSIIIVGLSAAAVVNVVTRLGARVGRVDESLHEIRGRLERIEQTLQAVTSNDSPLATTQVLDLAAMGRGDPRELVAASLDRSVFPRLATTMEQEPPAEVGGPHADSARGPSTGEAPHAADAGDQPAGANATGLTVRNLLRRWRVSLREGDLATCRRVYIALVETAGTATVGSMGGPLQLLADRIEQSLRDGFSKCARERDYDGLLAIGEQICRLFPDRPVAEEFKRLKPYLLRRGKQQGEQRGTASLRVAPG